MNVKKKISTLLQCQMSSPEPQPRFGVLPVYSQSTWVSDSSRYDAYPILYCHCLSQSISRL